jgi:hypothetical protein
LFAALAGWRAVANHLVLLPHDAARQQAAATLQSGPQELRSLPESVEAARWLADPIGLHPICEATVRRLIALPTGTPSLRLLADKTAEVLAGLVDAALLCLLMTPLDRFRAITASSGCACPIGCPLGSMPDGPSS